MSNIRRETKRHDWIWPVTLNNGNIKVPNSSKCRNCGKEVYGREPTETSGCPFELKAANFTREKMSRLTEYEMQQRQKEEAWDNYLARGGG